MRRDEPVGALPGVGEKRAQTLRAIGIRTVDDLLNHFPREYDDRSQVKTVSMLTPGVVNTLRGYIAGEGENIAFARGGGKASSAKTAKPLIMTKIRLRDHTGELELIWFNQPYLKKYFIKNQEYIFTGKVTYNYNRLQMESPDYEKISDSEILTGGRIVPLYTTAKNLSQKTFRSFIKNALDAVTGEWPDDLPSDLRRTFNLCERQTAIQHIHFPESDGHFLAARRRLVFEELFFMQSALLRMKGITTGEPGVVLRDTDYTPFLEQLPFQPTRAQAAVLDTMARDMQGGFRMNRLIQGDVGSGKTMVAMAASYLAIKNGFQAAIMAPTDVLAGQHYVQFSRYLAPLGIKTVLLTGSLPLKSRREAAADIEQGRAGMIVGTHALIQTSVRYHRLALVITDEQHRFGVNQRLTLSEKSDKPHVLVMTATPIPRTLGLILFGDMDVSIIDELPPGRQVIKTYCVDSNYRARVHGFIRNEVEQGRQAYVICPAIEEPEDVEVLEAESGAADAFSLDTTVRLTKADLQSVTRYTRELAETLPDITVACLHGRMKPADKQQVMDDFAANRIQVIVATTVIEVGVHVANATLMVVENADRFGLSQLHQLRGRVGRGQAQSYCVLVTDTKNEQTKARMNAMKQTTDGFKLSEMDMQLRGTGDFFGVRQHGLPSFSIANLYRDLDVLKEAQEAALHVFKEKIDWPPEEESRFSQRVNRILGMTKGGVPL